MNLPIKKSNFSFRMKFVNLSELTCYTKMFHLQKICNLLMGNSLL